MPDGAESLRDPFAPRDPDQERSERVGAALGHLAARHASTETARRRRIAPALLGADEAVRLVALLAAGGAIEPVEDEPEIDQADLVAALTVLPLARAELDEFEAILLTQARRQGMTWSQIAFGLGLRSAQAAQQRAERLASRGDSKAAGSVFDGSDRVAESRR